MIVRKTSQWSGKINEMDLDVTEDQIYAWRNGGGLIQNVFPHLTADEREFLMTGMTQEEWEDAFCGEDDGE
jgi:hypothetical protein